MDGQCPPTEASTKWEMKEKSIHEDGKGDKREPTQVYNGDKGCCQFTVPQYATNASKKMFNDECGPNFKCHDYQDETKSNVEKAGATFKTKAYVCSKKVIDNDKLCACSTKEEIVQAKKTMEKWIIAVVVVAILILLTLCVGLCYCRRRMKRSGAAASTTVSNPYLK